MVVLADFWGKTRGVAGKGPWVWVRVHSKNPRVTHDNHYYMYLLKSFSDTEQNYKIYDRELLAIVQALTDWKHCC